MKNTTSDQGVQGEGGSSSIRADSPVTQGIRSVMTPETPTAKIKFVRNIMKDDHGAVWRWVSTLRGDGLKEILEIVPDENYPIVNDDFSLTPEWEKALTAMRDKMRVTTLSNSLLRETSIGNREELSKFVKITKNYMEHHSREMMKTGIEFSLWAKRQEKTDSVDSRCVELLTTWRDFHPQSEDTTLEVIKAVENQDVFYRSSHAGYLAESHNSGLFFRDFSSKSHHG